MRSTTAVIALLFAACGGPRADRDAGGTDAGGTDAGALPERCEPAPGCVPAEEACDGDDDDCDLATDEGCAECAPRTSTIVSTSSDLEPPEVAETADGYLIAWSAPSTGIFVLRVDAERRPVGEPALVVPHSGFGLRGIEICPTGGGFLLAWVLQPSDVTELRTMALDAAGMPAGAARMIETGGVATGPSLACGGGELALAWGTSAATQEVYFVRLDASGAPAGAPVSITPPATRASEPWVEWTGDGWSVAWVDHSTNASIQLTRVDPSGVASSAVALTGLVDARSPALHWNGERLGAAWLQTGAVHFAPFDRDGRPMGCDSAIEAEPRAGAPPAIDWTGSVFALAWVEQTDLIGNDAIELARFDARGGSSGASERLRGPPGGTSAAALAWTGASHLAFFVDLALASLRAAHACP